MESYEWIVIIVVSSVAIAMFLASVFIRRNNEESPWHPRLLTSSILILLALWCWMLYTEFTTPTDAELKLECLNEEN